MKIIRIWLVIIWNLFVSRYEHSQVALLEDTRRRIILAFVDEVEGFGMGGFLEDCLRTMDEPLSVEHLDFFPRDLVDVLKEVTDSAKPDGDINIKSRMVKEMRTRDDFRMS